MAIKTWNRFTSHPFFSWIFFKKDIVKSCHTEQLIEPIDVYNIEVEDTHNYFHNHLGPNCDDLVTEQDALSGSPDLYENIWNWVMSGAMPRLQPAGRVVHIATRWSKQDPIGQIERKMKQDPHFERYGRLVVPALDENDESTFPEIWSTEALHAKRHAMPAFMWNAQYMQNPTTESGAIVPRNRWRKWDQFKRIGTVEEFIPPSCNLIMMVMDTAYTKNKRSNPTAVTIWGCFDRYDEATGLDTPSVILLHSVKKKMEFIELKRQAKEWIIQWQPDIILIEEKSSGPMLRAELNRAGIPVIPVSPRGQEDKISRLNSVTSVFGGVDVSGKSTGIVWYMPTAANDACIEEVNDFPNGAEDDFTDTVAYAMRHFRETGMLIPRDDSPFEPEDNILMLGSQYA